MILDINIINMGDKVYAAKLKHERLGLLKSIVEANSFTDAKNKINMNLKQSLWKKGISSKDSPIHFHFNCISLENHQISYQDTPDDLKQFHPDYINKQQEQDDPRVWSIEEIQDEHGHTSYRMIKHDAPLMNTVEAKAALMAKMFS